LLEQPHHAQENFGFDVSVIIPSNHRHDDLIFVTIQICNQTATPNEIIIIDSSDERGECPPTIQEQCRRRKINLTYKVVDNALPGFARNIGIEHSTNKFVAFIDVKTVPQQDWLAIAIRDLENTRLSGVWGKTTFDALTEIEKLTRDGFFGQAPRRTLPGTVLRVEALDITGRFIPWVRAGEDTDWMQRVELSRLPFVDPPSATLSYKGLLTQRPIDLARKWRRNYSASRALPHLLPQKFLVSITFYMFIILVALNWNNLLAGWESTSVFYIPNITKITAALPLLIYLIIRGVILPLRRRVPLSSITPFRWLAIAMICAIGDTAKITAFLLPQKPASDPSKITEVRQKHQNHE